jgi:hypothetical protein
MRDYENMLKATEAFEQMSDKYRDITLLKLLNDGTIDIVKAISVYSKYLEDYKRDAAEDIYRLSEIGLNLGENQIKGFSKSKKTDSEKEVMIAWIRTLVSGGGLNGTKFLQEMLEGIDLKAVDEQWYSKFWKLKRPNVPEVEKES